MDGLNDFIAFNFVEDEREAQERSATTEYPYQKQFWEDEESEDTSQKSNWDDNTSSNDDSY